MAYGDMRRQDLLPLVRELTEHTPVLLSKLRALGDGAAAADEAGTLPHRRTQETEAAGQDRTGAGGRRDDGSGGP